MQSSSKKLRVGLDIHGVIDKYPAEFSRLTNESWKDHEIYILTGQEWVNVCHKVEAAQIRFDGYRSIVDYHRDIGTSTWDNDPRGDGFWMEETGENDTEET